MATVENHEKLPLLALHRCPSILSADICLGFVGFAADGALGTMLSILEERLVINAYQEISAGIGLGTVTRREFQFGCLAGADHPPALGVEGVLALRGCPGNSSTVLADVVAPQWLDQLVDLGWWPS